MSEIQVNGVVTVGPYEGYYGRAEFDSDANIFHGQVAETKDVITFVGSNPTELRKAFRESIDDYLAFCKERGREADKPFSGRFLVRIPPELHRQLAIAASQSGISLNQVVIDTLTNALNQRITYHFTPPLENALLMGGIGISAADVEDWSTFTAQGLRENLGTKIISSQNRWAKFSNPGQTTSGEFVREYKQS